MRNAVRVPASLRFDPRITHNTGPPRRLRTDELIERLGPAQRIEARKATFNHGRHLRKRRQSRRDRSAKRTQISRPDLRCRRRGGGKHEIDLFSKHRGYPGRCALEWNMANIDAGPQPEERAEQVRGRTVAARCVRSWGSFRGGCSRRRSYATFWTRSRLQSRCRPTRRAMFTRADMPLTLAASTMANAVTAIARKLVATNR